MNVPITKTPKVAPLSSTNILPCFLLLNTCHVSNKTDELSAVVAIIEQVVGNEDVVVDGDTILFMDDTTSWEALDVHYHVSGMEIGNIPKKIESVKTFAENEKMVLDAKKVKK